MSRNAVIDLDDIFIFWDKRYSLLMAEAQQADTRLHPEVNLAEKNRR